eukprot:2539803-Lingulodinium_polyedra.AAC.1
MAGHWCNAPARPQLAGVGCRVTALRICVVGRHVLLLKCVGRMVGMCPECVRSVSSIVRCV